MLGETAGSVGAEMARNVTGVLRFAHARSFAAHRPAYVGRETARIPQSPKPANSDTKMQDVELGCGS